MQPSASFIQNFLTYRFKFVLVLPFFCFHDLVVHRSGLILETACSGPLLRFQVSLDMELFCVHFPIFAMYYFFPAKSRTEKKTHILIICIPARFNIFCWNNP